jgi:murein DD-endopeptidase MepM/ murein hydrolase activator NlpD
MQEFKKAILAQSRLWQQPKIRRSVAVALVSCFGMVAAFGTVPESPQLPLTSQTVVEALALQVKPVETQQVYWHEERFQRGDTYTAFLQRLGVDGEEAQRLVRRTELALPLRALRPGSVVQAQTADDGSLLSMRLIASRDTVVGVDREGENYRPFEQAGTLLRETQMKSGEIRSSLFAATDAAGVPDNVAIQLADIFGGDIDFHRDLRKGDSFSVVYEVHYLNGRPVYSGRILAAEFVNNKRVLRAVWFDEDGDGRGGYYTPEGKNTRKAFLRSPLEFSRVTSGFSMRFHPILQQWRAHKGVDYGAPIGTRVRATGDAVVEFAGRQGGYGNVIILRHNGSYSTTYGHLSGFAPGIKKGARVAQGDVIGFVGQTGWATGPHLHYEFRVNNEHRNPLTIALPAALPISPGKLAAFRAASSPLASQLDLLRNTNLALME